MPSNFLEGLGGHKAMSLYSEYDFRWRTLETS